VEIAMLTMVGKPQTGRHAHHFATILSPNPGAAGQLVAVGSEMYAYWDAVTHRNTGRLREISNKALQQFLEVSSKATLVPLQHGIATNEELEGNLNILITLLKSEVTLSGDATSVMQQRRTIEWLLRSAVDVQRGQLQYLGSLADERIKDAIRLTRPVVYASICSFEQELCGSMVGVRLTSEQRASVPVVGTHGCISESADLSELLTAVVADIEQQMQVTPNPVGLVDELFSSYITQLADLTRAAGGSAQQLLCSLTKAMRTDDPVLNGHDDSEAFVMIMAAVQLSLLQEVLRGKRGDIDNDAGPWEYVGNLVGCILTVGTAAELDALARPHGGSKPEREEANSPFSNVYTALCASHLLCKDLHGAVVNAAAAEHSPRVLASILSKNSSTQLPACDNGLRICAIQIAYRKLARPLKATLRLGWPADSASVFPICCAQATLCAAIRHDLAGVSDCERGLSTTAGLAGGFQHTLQVLHELQPWWAVEPVGACRLMFDACCAVDLSEQEASTHLLLLSRLLAEVASLVKLSVSEALTATAFSDALESDWGHEADSGGTQSMPQQSQDRWWALHVLLVIQFVGDSREQISAEVCQSFRDL
jgi:hypothetical protein